MNRKIKRRAFLQGLTAGVSTIALARYGDQSLARAREDSDRKLLLNPENLEKPNLTIGYVPVNDCAPFAVAYQNGLFRKYGLNVTLSREASWANSRDGVIFGRLDAAPVVSGAVMNARVGAEGARRAPLCAAMTIHRHGNAMTLSKELWENGLRPWQDYQGDLDAFGRDFHNYFSDAPAHKRSLAVVLSSAIYEYFVRYLIAATGLDPVEEFRIIITPPPQMVTNMRIGAMQAYMVAEPWNTRAISDHEGIGFTFAQGREIWRGHPDRVLAVMESFIDENPKTYRALVKAMIEACQYCSQPEHRSEVAEIISQRSYTGADPSITSAGIVGKYNYGGFDNRDRIVESLATTLFFDLPPEVSTVPNDHSTFLWQSQNLWLMTQAARWQQIEAFPKNAEQIAKAAWRTDLYREIANEMNIPCPAEDFKTEPADAFIDSKAFDPSDPVGYLKSFKIRANAPRTFFMT